MSGEEYKNFMPIQDFEAKEKISLWACYQGTVFQKKKKKKKRCGQAAIPASAETYIVYNL